MPVFEAVDGLVAEHAEIEHRLADPGIHSDQQLAKKLNQRYAELSSIIRSYREWLLPFTVTADDRRELGVPLVQLLRELLVGMDTWVGQPMLDLSMLGDQAVNCFEHWHSPSLALTFSTRPHDRTNTAPVHARMRGPALWRSYLASSTVLAVLAVAASSAFGAVFFW